MLSAINPLNPKLVDLSPYRKENVFYRNENQLVDAVKGNNHCLS